MNFKLILRTLLIIAVLFTLVILGMYNTQTVDLNLPKQINDGHPVRMAAAYMYYAFFGVGMVVGVLLLAGGKGGGSSSASAKSSK